MLAEGNLLELGKAVSLSSTVDDRVLEQVAIEAAVVDGALDAGLLFLGGRLNLIRVAALVVGEAGKVVTLVEVLEDGTEDLRFLVGQGDALGRWVHVCVSEGLGEERTGREDILVSGKETLLGADDEGDDTGGHSTERRGKACK